ncbi:unnamed protein product [Caenorhabditis brenneri]
MSDCENTSTNTEQSWALSGLNGALEEIEHDNMRTPKEAVVKTEMEKLVDFIGGLEKWSLLNEDCRQEIVKYLDYKTRCHLGICSKADFQTVERTPIHVHSIEIRDNNVIDLMYFMDDFDHVNVVVRFDDDHNSRECLDLIFSQEGEDTRILWLKYLPKKKPEKRQVIVESCNYYEVAVKFAEKWMRKCNYQLSVLTVSMSNYPFETSTINFLPKCRSISIDAKDMDGIDWWLQKVPEKLDGLFLPYFSDLPSEFWKRPQVTNVSGAICIPANLTDEQFLGLKAKYIRIESENITEQGINQFLKQYVNGRRENGVKEVIFWSDREWKKNEIIDGLKVQPWTSDFEIEEDAFCDDFRRICGGGEMYQIRSLMDPFESITLQISYDRVGIFGTGKRVTNDGVTSSEFSIPV